MSCTGRFYYSTPELAWIWNSLLLCLGSVYQKLHITLGHLPLTWIWYPYGLWVFFLSCSPEKLCPLQLSLIYFTVTLPGTCELSGGGHRSPVIQIQHCLKQLPCAWVLGERAILLYFSAFAPDMMLGRADISATHPRVQLFVLFYLSPSPSYIGFLPVPQEIMLFGP